MIWVMCRRMGPRTEHKTSKRLFFIAFFEFSSSTCLREQAGFGLLGRMY